MWFRQWQRSALGDARRLGGALGGLLLFAAGAAAIVLVLLPGRSGDHEDLAFALGVATVVYGLLSAFVIPWDRVSAAALHASTLVCVPASIVAGAWTGAADSPLRVLVLFVPVWAACFCSAPVTLGYLALASSTFLAPYFYDEMHTAAAPFVREQVVLTIGMGALTATVAMLRYSLDRAQRRAERGAAQQQALLRVATAVADGADSDAIVGLVAEEAARVLGADNSAVLRVDGDDVVLVGAWAGTPLPPGFDVGVRFPIASSTGTAQTLRTNAPVQHRVDRDEVSETTRRAHLGAIALAPVQAAEGPWGVISVTSNDPAGLPRDAAQRLMDFSALVTTAIVNAEQRERLSDQAFTDPLTGLSNHRAFHERLGTETARALRHDRALSLVLIDVDTFKQVNDNHGHEAGDRVLTEVAARLRHLGRTSDLLARIGGDEFAWLLPETEAADALALVERARDAVAAAPVGNGNRITISAGVCDLTYAVDADSLFRLADGALYWSKAHGRDAAHVYDPDTVRELSAAERADQLARHQALLGIRALARAIDAKDPTTMEHSGRVAELACGLARMRGWSEDRIRLMEEAATVHDVGKIGIADHILLKPSRLTDEEYEQVKQHAELGAQIVEDVLTPEQVVWIRGHHERPDGRGYPDGLTGAELSEGAALMALADAFDVMTAARPYSTPKPHDVALAECRELVGRQFTADAVDALEALERAAAPMLVG